MMIRKFVLSLWLLLVLSACGGHKLSQQAISATQTYYAQSVSVTPAPSFSYGNQRSRSSHDELARYFANEIQTGLQSDLKKTMRGRSPATVSVTLMNIQTGPALFMSPKTTVQANVTIIDVASGTTVFQFPVMVDDSDMQARTNSSPLSVLAASAILRTVTDAKDMTLWNLAKVVRSDINAQLGSRSLF